MEISEFLLQNLKKAHNYFIYALLSTLPADSYTLENGKLVGYHVFNNGNPVIAWLEVPCNSDFLATGETLLSFGSTSWWGITRPLEEINSYFLLKLEKSFIELSIASLTYRQMQIEAILTGREEEYKETMEATYPHTFGSWEENMAFKG